MESFTFQPAGFIPFQDMAAIEKACAIRREDITKHPNPDFRITVLPAAEIEFRWIMDVLLKKGGEDEERDKKAENTGVLISSGLIAGGALTAVIIAFIVLGYNPPWATPVENPEWQAAAQAVALDLKLDETPTFIDRARMAIGLQPPAWLGLIAYAGVAFLLILVPLRASRDGT